MAWVFTHFLIFLSNIFWWNMPRDGGRHSFVAKKVVEGDVYPHKTSGYFHLIEFHYILSGSCTAGPILFTLHPSLSRSGSPWSHTLIVTCSVEWSQEESKQQLCICVRGTCVLGVTPADGLGRGPLGHLSNGSSSSSDKHKTSKGPSSTSQYCVWRWHVQLSWNHGGNCLWMQTCPWHESI